MILNTQKYQSLLSLLWGCAFALFMVPSHYVVGIDSAFAEDSLKENILENCDAALTQLRAASESEKVAMIAYLERVLKLSSVAIDLAPDVVPPPARATLALPIDPLNFDFANTLEPGREQDAKLCAIRALALLEHRAVVSLPALAELSTEPLIPESMLASLEWSVFQIAHASRLRAPSSISRKILEQLLSIHLTHPESCARLVLLEFGNLSVAHLFQIAVNQSSERYGQVADLLIAIDSQGASLGSELRTALESGHKADVLLSLMIISRINGSFASYAGSILSAFNVSEAPIREAALSALQRSLLDSATWTHFKIEPTHLDRILQFLQTGTFEQRSVLLTLLEFLLNQNAEHIVPALLEIARQKKGDLEREIIRLLSKLDSLSSPVVDSVFQYFAREMYDDDVKTRMAALHALGNQFARSPQVLSLFAHYAKSTLAKMDLPQRDDIVLTFVEALQRLSVGQAGVRFISVGIDSLDLQPALAPYVHPGVQFLIALGKSIISPLGQYLPKASALGKVRALYVLGRVRPVTPPLIATIMARLSDEDQSVRDEAAVSLTQMGEEAAKKDVQRAISRAQAPQRQLLAQVLADWGSLESRYFPDLRDRFASGSCDQKAHVVEPLLAHAPDKRALCEQVVPSLIQCISNATSEISVFIHRIALCAPLSKECQESLFGMIRDASLNPAVSRSLLRNWSRLSLDSKQLAHLLEGLLHERNNPNRRLLATTSGELAAQFPELLTALEKVIDEERRPSVVRSEAFVTYTFVRPQEEKIREYLRSELRGDMDESDSEQLLSVVRRVGKAISPFLRQMVPELSLTAKAVAIQALGLIPDDYDSNRDLLLTFAADSEPRLRAAALAALLRLSPSDPVVLKNMKFILVSRYFRWLVPYPLSPQAMLVLRQAANELESPLALSRVREIVPSASPW